MRRSSTLPTFIWARTLLDTRHTLLGLKVGYSYIIREHTLSQLTDRPIREVRSFYRDLHRTPQAYIAYSAVASNWGGRRSKSEELYVLIRALPAQRVVETGVANGISTAFILQGLRDNGNGILHSIDFPNLEKGANFLPSGREVGWAIPESLRHPSRWQLTIERTKTALPRVLEDLTSIDLFFHDSEHSFENMTFEFEAAWPFLRPGGLLVSDDIDQNSAFKDFAKRHRVHPARLTYYGAIRKPFDGLTKRGYFGT